MLFVMFSASVLSYTLKPFRRIPQIFPKILRRNRQKSPQIPSGPAYEQFIYANAWTAMLISAVILLRLLY